jgi:hypothetical protein
MNVNEAREEAALLSTTLQGSSCEPCNTTTLVQAGLDPCVRLLLHCSMITVVGYRLGLASHADGTVVADA